MRALLEELDGAAEVNQDRLCREMIAYALSLRPWYERLYWRAELALGSFIGWVRGLVT